MPILRPCPRPPKAMGGGRQSAFSRGFQHFLVRAPGWDPLPWKAEKTCSGPRPQNGVGGAG